MATPEELLKETVGRFSPEAARGMRGVFGLRLNGDGGGDWHVTVAEGKCELAPGPASAPDVSIAMSVENWVALMSGQLGVQQAFFEGRVEVKGSLFLAMALPELFPR